MKANAAWQKDKYIISSLYLTNGFIVILTTHAFICSSSLLLALGIGLTIIGISIKENDMQIWLRRYLLGSQSSFLGFQRYTPFSSFDEQQKNWNLNFAK